MKKSARDWLLLREEAAGLRLDAIRRGVVVPERATLAESLIEVFRPNLRVWVSLVLVWVLLAAAQFGMGWKDRATIRSGPRFPELASQGFASNERIPELDGHF